MEKGHRRSDPKMHAPKHENSQKEHDSLQISSPSKLKRIISLQVGGRDGSLTLIIPARLATVCKAQKLECARHGSRWARNQSGRVEKRYGGVLRYDGGTLERHQVWRLQACSRNGGAQGEVKREF